MVFIVVFLSFLLLLIMIFAGDVVVEDIPDSNEEFRKKSEAHLAKLIQNFKGKGLLPVVEKHNMGSDLESDEVVLIDRKILTAYTKLSPIARDFKDKKLRTKNDFNIYEDTIQHTLPDQTINYLNGRFVLTNKRICFFDERSVSKFEVRLNNIFWLYYEHDFHNLNAFFVLYNESRAAAHRFTSKSTIVDYAFVVEMVKSYSDWRISEQNGKKFLFSPTAKVDFGKLEQELDFAPPPIESNKVENNKNHEVVDTKNKESELMMELNPFIILGVEVTTNKKEMTKTYNAKIEALEEQTAAAKAVKDYTAVADLDLEKKRLTWALSECQRRAA